MEQTKRFHVSIQTNYDSIDIASFDDVEEAIVCADCHSDGGPTWRGRWTADYNPSVMVHDAVEGVEIQNIPFDESGLKAS